MANDRVIGFRIQVEGSETTVKSIKELEQAVKNTNDRLKESDIGSEKYREIQKELAEAKALLQGVRKEQRLQIKEAEGIQSATGSYRQLNAELIKARNRFKELSREDREGEIGANLTKQVQELDKELKDLDKSIGQSQRNVGNYSSAFDGIGASLKGFVANLPTLAIGALTAAIGVGIEAVREITKEFRELRGEIEQVTGATGENLDKFTAQISALSKTFEEDTDTILLAANSLSQQLTGDFGVALDAIAEGFINGANANGEFLDSLKEYSAQAAAAGLTTKQFVNLLAQTTRQGIFSDKGIDTVKEFGLRIREQTKSTRESLVGAFGAEFTNSLFNNINSGATTTVDALQQVATKINDTEIPVNRLQTLITDTFGGAGEDAGIQFIKSLSNIEDGFESLNKAGGEYGARQRRIFNQNLELADAQNKLSKELAIADDSFTEVSTTLKTRLSEALTTSIRNAKALFGAVGDLGRRFNEFVKGSSVLAVTLRRLQSVFKGLVQAVFLGASVDLPAAFAGLGAAISRTAEIAKERFEELAINAQILQLRLRKSLSVRSNIREQISEDIKALKSQRSAIATEGESIGEAFNRAFTAAVERRAQQRTEAVTKQEAAAQAAKAAAERAAQKAAFEGGEEAENAAGSIERLKDEIDDLKDTIQTTNLSTSEFVRLSQELEKKEDELAVRIIKRQEALREAAGLAGKLSEISTKVINTEIDENKKLTKEQKKSRENAIKDAKKTADEQTEINRAKNKKLIEQEQELEQFKRDAAIQAAQLVADTVFEIAGNNATREKDERLSSLDRQLQAELLSVGNNEKAREDVEKKFAKRRDAIDEEFRKREKRRAIAQAIVNGAVAITRILAEVPKADFGVATGILIALATAQTAAQVAVISSQQFAKGGVLSGNSHATGGVPVRVGGSGIVEAEGGEAIINKRSTAMFRPLLSAINAAGGGVRFQGGGVLPGAFPIPGNIGGIGQFQAQQVAILNELAQQNRATQELALSVRESVINLSVNLDTDELDGVQNTKVALDSAKTL